MRSGQSTFKSLTSTSTTSSSTTSTPSTAPASVHHIPGAKGEVMTSALFPEGLPQEVLGYFAGDVKNVAGLSATKLQEFKFFGRNYQEAILDPLATRAATLILGGEENEVKQALALVKKYPGILHRRVIARDRFGSPALC